MDVWPDMLWKSSTMTHISETTRDIKVNFSGHIPWIVGQVYIPKTSFGLKYWRVYDQIWCEDAGNAAVNTGVQTTEYIFSAVCTIFPGSKSGFLAWIPLHTMPVPWNIPDRDINRWFFSCEVCEEKMRNCGRDRRCCRLLRLGCDHSFSVAVGYNNLPHHWSNLSCNDVSPNFLCY